MEEMHTKIDTKLNATTQSLQKSMSDFIAQMSQLKSSVFMEQENNSVRSDKSGMDSSAGSKRLASTEEKEHPTSEKDNLNGIMEWRQC